MSESRPPSPVHPRVFNTSVKEMAETQRAPALPISPFLGQPERHNSVSGYQTPSSSSYDTIHDRPHVSFHPPFTTLPPLLGRPSASSTNPGNYVQQAVPISKLLSDAPQAISPRSRPLPAMFGPRSPELLSSPPSNPAVTFVNTYQRNPSQSWPTSNTRQPSVFQVPRHPSQTQKAQSGVQYSLQSPPISSHSPSSASLESGTSPQEPQSAGSDGFNRLPSFSAPSSNLRYELSMRQQPVAARACGFGERDRRVVDPPPILELTVIDAETGSADREKTPYVYTTLHCTLINAVTLKDESQIEPPHANMPATQRLMGTAVASPFSGTDEHGRRGTFFVFPDLSCRSPGRFRFQFRLLIVDPLNLSVGTTSRIQSSIISEPFEVYTAKEFPGMRASSALLKTLRRQGLNVAVKKGREATKKASRRTNNAGDDSSDDEDQNMDEDEGDSDEGPSNGRDKRKRKRRE